MNTIIVEISPLWGRQYTGVANVVYEFVSCSLKSESVEFKYIFFGHIIPSNIMQAVIDQRTFTPLRDFMNNKASKSNEYASLLSDRKIPILFTNTCNVGNYGSPQAQIIYDLSYFSFADYHTSQNVSFMTSNFKTSILSNKINFCISDSTRLELDALFSDQYQVNSTTIPLGPSLLEEEVIQTIVNTAHSNSFYDKFSSQARYFMFMSTIEPRKNLDLILASLNQYPNLFGDNSLVVVGRDGWNVSWDSLINKYELQHLVDDNTLIRLPYVTEAQKYLLLKNCQALIYPSCYEGFGLPVLEALSLDVPVIASCASSIPEVGGPSLLYFDPYSIKSFCDAITSFLDGDYLVDFEQTRTWISKFQYQTMFDLIVKQMSALVDS